MIVNLSENVHTNERLTSELVVINTNNIFENTKCEKYGHQNNVKISVVSNEIPDQDLEERSSKYAKTWIAIYHI